MEYISHLKNVAYDNESLIYTAGDRITGSFVFVGTPSPGIKIYSMEVKLRGKIMVMKNPSVASLLAAKMESNYPSESVHSSCILSKTPGEFMMTFVPRTTRILPFSLDVPENLPSSFVGSHGFICYRIFIEVKPNLQSKPMKFFVTKEVIIIGKVSPTFALDSQMGMSRRWKSVSLAGDVIMIGELETLDCVPGEDLIFTVLIQNWSKLSLSGVKMNLIMTESYSKLRSVCRKEQDLTTSKCILQVDGPTVPPRPGRQVTWNGRFKVPHVVPSGLGPHGCCENIDVQYAIQLELKKFVPMRGTLRIHITTAPKICDTGSAYKRDLVDSCAGNLGSTLGLVSIPTSSGSPCRSSASTGCASDCGSLLSIPNSNKDASRRGSSPPSYDTSLWLLNNPTETPPPTYGDTTAAQAGKTT